MANRMAAEPSTLTRVLGHKVHARLLIKHVLLAKERSGPAAGNAVNGSASASTKQPTHQVLAIRGAASNSAHCLVYDFVRVVGTAVHQRIVEIDGKMREFVYVDDGTGVLPFTLSKQTNGSTSDDVTYKEMQMRLVQAKNTDGSYSGRAIDVRGRICRRSASLAAPLLGNSIPPVWIECYQLVVHRDPMSEVVALTDTLNIYSHYFPEHRMFKGSDSALNDASTKASQDMCGLLRTQSRNTALPKLIPPDSSTFQISPRQPSSKRTRIYQTSPSANSNREPNLSTHTEPPSSPTGRIRKAQKAERSLLSSDPFGHMDVDEDQLLDVLNDLDVLPTELPEVKKFLADRPNGATHNELAAMIRALGNDPNDVIEEMLFSAIIFQKGTQYFLV